MPFVSISKTNFVCRSGQRDELRLQELPAAVQPSHLLEADSDNEHSIKCFFTHKPIDEDRTKHRGKGQQRRRKDQNECRLHTGEE